MKQLPKELENYFSSLNEKTLEAFDIAKQARGLGYDPATSPEVKIAKNMAERVVGLVSFLAPQIVGTGIDRRIEELEQQFSILDWRVAFTIALEVSQQKFCKFADEREAMEVGIRIGFAYVTNGVVSSPLEGFVNLQLIDRKDNTGKFFRLNYAGPVRNAGGTAAACSVLIADYVRKHMGYKEYDPQPDEIKRCFVEISNYHERVTNLQYFPSEEESDFLVSHMPIEVSGDPTEKYEVSNYKNLPRIPTNRIRAGYCLIYSSCIPLKAPKLWKQLSKWGKDMGMEQWDFLEKFIKIQKTQQAKGQKTKDTSGPKITPNFTFIADLVGGRPVFGHPLRPGGMRLRFGRSRLSGLSGQSLHPATMIIANEFIATASQLKVERPGKAAAYTVCDQLEGPIVRLTSGEVLQVTSSEQARMITNDVEKILYLGDVLINYGDFLDRAHMLVPPGYCEEWWVQEAKKAGCDISEQLWNNPITTQVTFEDAVQFAKEFSIPLHPKYTFFYKLVSVDQLRLLWEHIKKAPAKKQLIFRNSPKLKKVLEILGVFHKVVQSEYLVVLGDHAKALRFCFSREAPQQAEDPMQFMQAVSPVFLRDKAGIFIGSRLGRPEKAKMRKLTGSPHTLFPCGNEGGRLRSINESIAGGFVTSTFEVYQCPSCDEEVVLPRCPKCDSICPRKEDTPKNVKVEMRPYLISCLKKMHTKVYPDLIKGVRGTVNEEHATEHLMKGILRARHEIYVNKDGTVRYDASEVPITHFRPKEIGISVEQTKNLGYVKDIHGTKITSEDQVIEMFPQDVILPACDESPDERSDDVLLRTAQFIDELLVQLYNLKPYYNAKAVSDLIGHHIIALAPHTSAGTIGRIIGFSKTQGLFYHPYLHCATRRDCFTKETYIPICKDGVWSVEKLGMLVEKMNPTRVVDSHGTKEINPEGYSTMGYVEGKLQEVPVKAFTKHTPMPIVSIKTHLGKEIRTTANHKHVVSRAGKEILVRAKDLHPGDVLKIPYNFPVDEKDVAAIDLIAELKDEDWLMVRGLKKFIPHLTSELVKQGVSSGQAYNYSSRDSVPVCYAIELISKFCIDKKDVFVAAKRDTVRIPAMIPLSRDFLCCIGLYVAEGYARAQKGVKGSYQVYISASKRQIREFVKQTFFSLGLKPSEKKDDRVTYSSRIIYELFTSILEAGSGAYKKRIPKKLLCLPLKRLGYVLSGYFEGDGSVSKSDLRITFDTVSKGLQQDMQFALSRFGVFVKYRTSTRQPGNKVRSFYERKGREVPYFTCTKGIIQSKFFHSLSESVSFLSSEKQSIQQFLLEKRKHRYLRCKYDVQFFYDEVIVVEEQPPETSYCLTVPGHHVVANGILTRQCDGDEGCVFLMMDAFLNFSQRYLPSSRGGTMDAPIVLTTVLAPAEVDDMVLNVDIAWRYPLEFYEACLEYKMPWEVKIPIIDHVLDTPEQFFGMGFTHDTADMNDGNHCSAYKTLPTMQDKLESQMNLAEKLSAVDEKDVARLVIEKHFIRDLKGNLRKFSQQGFRCVKCNAKYRRPPLRGICSECHGKIIFTISEGSVVKYLSPCESLVRAYDLDPYLAQSIELTRRRVEEVFGKDHEKQLGLGDWFG